MKDCFGNEIEPVAGLNIALLRKGVEWVEEQDTLPERDSAWYQAGIVTDGWGLGRSCGTAYCLAGYVAMVETGDERPRDAVEVALKALGLNYYTVHGLFGAGNSAREIRRIAEAMAGEPL